MSVGFVFWLLMIIVLVFGLWGGWATPPETRPFYFGGGFLIWILFFLVGVGLFGWPIHG